MTDDNEPDTRLKIETDDVSVEVEGTAGDVAGLYAVMRQRLAKSFRKSMQQSSRSDSPAPEGAESETNSGATQQLHEPDAAGPAEDDRRGPSSPGPQTDGPDDGTLQLIARCQRFTKVHLVETSNFQTSFLGRQLDPSAIGRLYVSGEDASRLREALAAGDTLWRELTPRGRALVDDSTSGEHQPG